MVDAVFFDLFETLITERERVLNPPPNTLRLNVDEQTFRSEFRARRDSRMTGKYPDYASVLREICLAAGEPVDEGQIRRIEKERISSYSELFIKPDPDVLNMLENIRAMGIKVGLISNISPEEAMAWKGSWLADMMDCATLSFQAGVMKPNTGIYLLACGELGVSPEQCIFVGDGGHNELPGAESAGMTPYCATWFMDRWPERIRMGHRTEWNTAYPRLRNPGDLIKVLSD